MCVYWLQNWLPAAVDDANVVGSKVKVQGTAIITLLLMTLNRQAFPTVFLLQSSNTTSSVVIQFASGAYAPLVSKIHNIIGM